jgi:DNA-binding transcriptional LysR family regulator
MLETQDLMVFVKVMETESLTRAGLALGLPKSTVSRRISRIERHLGAQLLRRSTHSITATEQGTVFYEYCLRCLGVLRDGERAVQSRHREPQGLLKICVPPELDRSLLGPLLTDYLERFPDVRLVSVLASEQIDLLRGGFDVAIVAGALPMAESSLMVTSLGHTDYGLYAAPGYRERKGVPMNHTDLRRFDLLAWGAVDVRARWRLTRQDQDIEIDFRPRLTCNDLILLRQAVLSGLGIAALPAYICKHDLAAGRMVEVLPDWRTPGVSFYAVFPKHEVVPLRARAFIDFLVEQLRRPLTWELRPNALAHGDR